MKRLLVELEILKAVLIAAQKEKTTAGKKIQLFQRIHVRLGSRMLVEVQISKALLVKPQIQRTFIEHGRNGYAYYKVTELG
jgi:hypothetical protein